MAKNKIKTYSTETFRDAYMKPEKQLDALLKSDFGKFFITRVEDLIRLIRLPVPPLRSTTHTFIYLTSGEATMTIGSQAYTIVKDECLVVPTGQLYSFAKHDINKGFLCNFHNDMIIGKFGKNDLLKTFEFLNVWANPKIRLEKQISAFVLQILKRIFIYYTENGIQKPEIIQAYFIALLCEINNAYKPVSSNKQIQSVNLANAFRQALFEHIKSKHRVSDYAELLKISSNHLNKVVKQITGKSPGKWIDETLVMEAKVLLFQTDLTINEIAAETGMYDPSYFSRLFKKMEGITPLQFRKRIEMS